MARKRITNGTACRSREYDVGFSCMLALAAAPAACELHNKRLS